MGDVTAALGGRQWADRGASPDQGDDELVAGVRAGDPAAFEQIYDRYAGGILAFCVHMLGNREAAEDALQLTFVSAYRALRSGQSSITLRPWLYTIARNRCLSELRARRDGVCVDAPVTDLPVIDGLAEQVQRREDLREMLDDMRRLPADQRAALVLFELGDQPQKEIANVLGVRTEKVKALVFQAREALVRGRQARDHPCREIREQMATLEGRIPARSMLRAHIERCPGCQSFESEVRHQRAALALILPVALTGELKSWVLGSALHGSHAVAAGVGACGAGGGAVAAGSGAAAAGGGAVAAGTCGGGAVVGGLGGGGALSATAAGGIVGTGAGAVAAGAPIAAAAAGLTAAGETVSGLGATGVVAKLLTAAAIATVAASSGHSNKPLPTPHLPAVTARQGQLASVVGSAAPAGAPAARAPLTGAPPTATATPLGSPATAPSATPAGSVGSTSSSAPTPSAASSLAPPGTTGNNPAGNLAATPPAAGSTPTSGTPSLTPSATPTGSGSAPSGGASGGSETTTTPSPSSPPASTSSSGDSSSSTPSTPPASTGETTGGGSGSSPPPASTGATGATGTSGGSTSSTGTSAGSTGTSAGSTGTSGGSTGTSAASAPATSTAADPSTSTGTTSSAATAPATSASAPATAPDSSATGSL